MIEEKLEQEYGAYAIQVGTDRTKTYRFWTKQRAEKIVDLINKGRAGASVDTQARLIDDTAEAMQKNQEDAARRIREADEAAIKKAKAELEAEARKAQDE